MSETIQEQNIHVDYYAPYRESESQLREAGKAANHPGLDSETKAAYDRAHLGIFNVITEWQWSLEHDALTFVDENGVKNRVCKCGLMLVDPVLDQSTNLAVHRPQPGHFDHFNGKPAQVYIHEGWLTCAGCGLLDDELHIEHFCPPEDQAICDVCDQYRPWSAKSHELSLKHARCGLANESWVPYSGEGSYVFWA